VDQDDVIRQLVARYNVGAGSAYRVTRWPDKENRSSRDCDAIAEAPGLPALAIEHTKVETFSGQSRDGSEFQQILGEVERSLRGTFDYSVDVVIRTSVMPPKARFKRKDLAAALCDWLLRELPLLPMGRSLCSVTGVPFELTICKDSQPPHYFCVSRFVPPGLEKRNDVVSSVAAVIEDRLRNKDHVVAKYIQSGCETLLLLESEDIALVSHAILYQGFLRASTTYSVQSIKQVWLARMEWYPAQFVCFQGPEILLNNINPPNFLIGPQYAQYWANAPEDLSE